MNGAEQLSYKEFATDIGATLKPVVAQKVQNFLDDNGGPEKFVGADAHAGLRAFAESQLQSHLTELGLQFKDLQCELENEATWRGKSDKLKRLSAELQDAQKQNEVLKRERDEIEARAEQASELEKQRYAQILERNIQKQREFDVKQDERLAIFAKELREMKRESQEGKSNEQMQLIQAFQKQHDALLKHLESREAGNTITPYIVAPVGPPVNLRPDIDPAEKRAKQLLERAKGHVRVNNHDAALETLNAAIKTDPEFIDAYKLLGEVKAGKRDYDGAIDAYEKIVALNPIDENAYLAIARCNEQIDNHDGAIKAYENIVLLRKGN